MFSPPVKPLHILVHQLRVLVVVNEDDAEVPREDETVMLLAIRGLLLLLTPPGLHTPLGHGPGGQTGSEHLFATDSSGTEHRSQGRKKRECCLT